MADKRVGVLSENSHLVVGLSLQGDGLEIERVDDLAGLAQHDVALVDLGDGQDPDDLTIHLPDGPAVVLLADGQVEVSWATIVHRPYTYGELLDVLRTVRHGSHQVFTQPPAQPKVSDVPTVDVVGVDEADEPGDAQVPGREGTPAQTRRSGSTASEQFRLFTARRSRSRSAQRSARTDSSAGSTSSTIGAATSEPTSDLPALPDASTVRVPPADPLFGTSPKARTVEDLNASSVEAPVPNTEHVEAAPTAGGSTVGVEAPAEPAEPATDGRESPARDTDPLEVVGNLAGQVTDAFSRAPFLVSQRVFAERLSALIRDSNEAAHVALWRLYDDAYEIVGAAGLRVTSGLTSLPADHPLLVATREHAGSLVRGVGDPGSDAGGLPGSVARHYACLMVDDDRIPIDLVTISGDHVSRATLHAVQIVIDESVTGWDSVAHVEELRRVLGLG